MQTSLTLAQLADPGIERANEILRSCVHCGFCTATCPTYVTLGDERDSPRGRIYMIREMLQDGGAPDPNVVTHIDRCLSCLSCMTTCPASVHYMHLVDHTRSHIQEHHTRPFLDRALRRMDKHGFRQLPVMARHAPGVVTGILERRHVITAYRRALELEPGEVSDLLDRDALDVVGQRLV